MAMFHDWFYLVLMLVGESEMVAELRGYSLVVPLVVQQV